MTPIIDLDEAERIARECMSVNVHSSSPEKLSFLIQFQLIYTPDFALKLDEFLASIGDITSPGDDKGAG